MRGAKYNGFNYTKCRIEDNTSFYRHCLSHPEEAAEVGVKKEVAEAGLDFLKRFPPNREHDKLSAHKAEVYVLRNPVWQRRGELLIPQGDLEVIFSMDFGDAIKQICEEESKMQERLGVTTIDLGDGTIVTGVRIRKSNYGGTSNRRTIPNEHLLINFDSSNYEETGDFTYAFDINRPSITTKQPKEFHIQSYLLVDGEEAWKEREVARAAFKPAPDGKTPVKFSHLVFTPR